MNVTNKNINILRLLNFIRKEVCKLLQIKVCKNNNILLPLLVLHTKCVLNLVYFCVTQYVTKAYHTFMAMTYIHAGIYGSKPQDKRATALGLPVEREGS